jgi:hypothetical protein
MDEFDYSQEARSFFDIVSIGGAVGSFIGALPVIAAAASLFWTLLRIYETKTIQKLLGNKEV